MACANSLGEWGNRTARQEAGYERGHGGTGVGSGRWRAGSLLGQRHAKVLVVQHALGHVAAGDVLELHAHPGEGEGKEGGEGEAKQSKNEGTSTR